MLVYRSIAFLILGIACLQIVAQDTSEIDDYAGAIITSYRQQKSDESSLNIRRIPLDSFSMGGNFTLCDVMARVPGVSMLSTGPGISKPVIRGLYGNRVLVLLNGLKFDNQQWQEEHGLGLSDAGLSSVEIIKGPMGILYGSEAIGGVVNLIDESKAAIGKSESDYKVKFFSNTLGMDFSAGFKTNLGKKWYGIRLQSSNHADYFDGSHLRVLNSRMDAYMLKANYGFKFKKWTSDNHFLSSFNRFGFIFNDIYTFVEEDARYNRSLNVNPAHMVLLNVVNSENKFRINKSQLLTFNAGLQSNRRMENEGGGAISLDMHLLTAQYQLKYDQFFKKGHHLILSNSVCFEDNTNFGARKIVPDAHMSEYLFSAFYEFKPGKKMTFENGLGMGSKNIKTFFTASVNGPDKEVRPFNKSAVFYNVFSGWSYRFDSASFMKINIASGVRVANLAELSSDGLHEGVFTFEIGNPDLKNEQNLSLNFESALHRKTWSLGISPFINFFSHYIFLAPTLEEWNGFPVFRYQQTDAFQRGGEAFFSLRPCYGFEIETTVSGMMSTTSDGLYTPYTPANKLQVQIKKHLNILGYSLYFKIGSDFYQSQKQLYTNEKGTPAYYLLDCSARGYLGLKQSLEWQFSINNLNDATYYDHLSRFKYFGLYNLGRNYVFSLKWKVSRTNN